MNPEDLQPQHWYWVRRADQSLSAYQFHRVRCQTGSPNVRLEFFVGSMIQTFLPNQVVAEAQMPRREQ